MIRADLPNTKRGDKLVPSCAMPSDGFSDATPENSIRQDLAKFDVDEEYHRSLLLPWQANLDMI